jgi:hypothetical protein
MVQGLFTNAAVKTTNLLKRNIHANKRQLTVCNPMVGEKAMKIPTAKAVAILLGESFNWKRLLMRSLIYFIRACGAERSCRAIRARVYPSEMIISRRLQSGFSSCCVHQIYCLCFRDRSDLCYRNMQCLQSFHPRHRNRE